MQWLAAVELGLLKGRHPLLKDVEVTINPLKGLAFVEGKPPPKSSRANKFFNLEKSSTFNEHSMDPTKLETAHIHPGQNPRRSLHKENELQQVNNDTLQESSSVDAEVIEEDERGQVLQTAEVIMNMLDVTMPGTLTEEHKTKVTLMNH